jgi:hypothetical protein
MKWFFGILLLASLALGAFIKLGGTSLGDNKMLQAQAPLYPEKIKLLPIAPVSAVTAVTAQSSVQTNLTATSSVPQTNQSCVEWGDFSASELSRATSALNSLHLGDTLSQREVIHANGYWVYLPPLNTSAEVTKTITQIKNLGLEEFYVVQDEGKWKNAISLGVFKSQDAANKFRDSLRAKGLKFASMGERKSTHLTVLIVKTPGTDAMEKISSMQKDFPDTKLKATDCQQSIKAN